MKLRAFIGSALLAVASPAFALNILLTNDDGLTSNLKALYDALKAEGHDVIVSVPCTAQSGRSAAIVMYSSTVIVADNDSQITAEGGCHNGAAPTGSQAAGAFTKTGYTNGDFHYAHGTPVMATLYGLDILAKNRWGSAPALVLSGPNEGQNVGKLVLNSGTIGNAQMAATRGIPSIALSAGTDTVDNTNLAAPLSLVVAQQSVKLIKALQAKAGTGPLLPLGLALNVNFPTGVTADTAFAFSRIGSYDQYSLSFRVVNNAGVNTYTLSGAPPAGAATPAQAEDEVVINKTKISVTAMQLAYDHRVSGQQWLRLRLRELFGN